MYHEDFFDGDSSDSLLEKLSDLIDDSGIDSNEVRTFLSQHVDNLDLQNMAGLLRQIFKVEEEATEEIQMVLMEFYEILFDSESDFDDVEEFLTKHEDNEVIVDVATAIIAVKLRFQGLLTFDDSFEPEEKEDPADWWKEPN